MATNQEMLDAVQAAITASVAKGLQSYSLSTGGGSRSAQRYSLTELQELEKYYKAELVKENRAGNGIRVRQIIPQ